MTNTVRKGAILMGTLVAFGSTPGAMGDPVLPGFTVERYANWDDPAGAPWELAFAPSGVLYVGRDAGAAAFKILRFDVGGTPAEGLPIENYEYGQTAIDDPDAVIFDALGTFSGTAGSVLVGTTGGKVWAIHPDETVNLLWQGAPIVNPHKMALDNTGRLLVSDESGQSIYVSDGGFPTGFASGNAYSGIAVDIDNHVFARTGGTIHSYDSDGTLLDSAFVTGLQNPQQSTLAFGPGGVWGTDLYTVSGGDLLRYDPVIGSPTYGDSTNLGSGFDSAVDITFGPDGALYVSTIEDTIFRIVPEPAIPTVSEWGVVVMTLLLLSAGKVVLRARRTATR